MLLLLYNVLFCRENAYNGVCWRWVARSVEGCTEGQVDKGVASVEAESAEALSEDIRLTSL